MYQYLFCSYVPGGSMVKNLPAVQKPQIRSMCQENSLEKERAVHSSVLAWKIPQSSLVGYSPWGRKRGRYNLATKQQMIHKRPMN